MHRRGACYLDCATEQNAMPRLTFRLRPVKMPQDTLDNNISEILSKYQYPDKAKRDVSAAVRQYKNLRVKLDTYVFNSDCRQELACLDGTIPVMYRGTYYHIPVCVWLLDSHPYNSPICYVKPTSNMRISASQHVDTNGRVYLPYLRNWQPDCSNLLGVIRVMIIAFGETPPVYSKPKSPNSSSSLSSMPYPVKASNLPVIKDELSEESQSSEKEAVGELQSSLRSLLKSGEDCDVTIKVRGKEFRAHRLILRSRSPVFRAMFTHDMLEKQRGAVTMEDCEPDIFPDFLEHIYTGNVGMISEDNVFSLYSASEKYDLRTLKKECTRFMEKNITEASFCYVITLAVKHNEMRLIERATEFFCSNSLAIVKTANWQMFLAENPTVGNELLIKLLAKH